MTRLPALVLGVTLASSSTLALPALAQDEPIIIIRGVPDTRDKLIRLVDIGDLDLSEAAGREAMDARVGKAVEDMCAVTKPVPGYGDEMSRPCRDEAWSSARPQMERAVALATGS